MKQMSITKPMPHVYRVEQLIHAELYDYRKKEPQCMGCWKSHKEWFEIPHKHAVKVVTKWASWMLSTNPYEMGEKSLGASELSRWQLKYCYLADLRGVCLPCPISLLGPVVKQTSKTNRSSSSGGAARSPRRSSRKPKRMVPATDDKEAKTLELNCPRMS